MLQIFTAGNGKTIIAKMTKTNRNDGVEVFALLFIPTSPV